MGIGSMPLGHVVSLPIILEAMHWAHNAEKRKRRKLLSGVQKDKSTEKRTCNRSLWTGVGFLEPRQRKAEKTEYTKPFSHSTHAHYAHMHTHSYYGNDNDNNTYSSVFCNYSIITLFPLSFLPSNQSHVPCSPLSLTNPWPAFL